LNWGAGGCGAPC